MPGSSPGSGLTSDERHRRCRMLSECYPYTALVGASEPGHDTERPHHKRRPPRLTAAAWRLERARTCLDLIRRLAGRAGRGPAATIIAPARAGHRRWDSAARGLELGLGNLSA